MQDSIKDLKDRIKNKIPQLTESQKVVANYIVENPQKFALSSVRQLEAELKTSKSTIVRLAQALGYEGFQEIRSSLLNNLRKELDPINRYKSLLSINNNIEKLDYLNSVADESINNINRTLDIIDKNQWNRTIKLLKQANHVYTMGLGVSSILAQLASYLFNRVSIKSSSLVSRSLSFPEQIINLSVNDLIFAFSFPPYSKETIQAASYANEKDIRVVSITDKSTNDIIQYSAAYLTVAVESDTISNSITPIQVILYALCTQIGHELKSKTLTTIEAIEHVRKEHSA